MIGKYNVNKTVYRLYQYNDDNFRIVKIKYYKEAGWEEIHKGFKKNTKEDVERVSLSRTKRRIREIALCNNFDYFCTFTVDKRFCDRYDVDVCQENLKKLFKSYKRKNPNFAYLFITEKHKNGGFHFHGLIRGIDKNDLYINDNGYYSIRHFDVMGFNSISQINDYYKCCNYITKYITKDCVRNKHRQIYISSRGLKSPSVSDIKPIEDIYNFENDFVAIRDFSISNLSFDEKLKISQSFIDN